VLQVLGRAQRLAGRHQLVTQVGRVELAALAQQFLSG